MLQSHLHLKHSADDYQRSVSLIARRLRQPEPVTFLLEDDLPVTLGTFSQLCFTFLLKKTSSVLRISNSTNLVVWPEFLKSKITSRAAILKLMFIKHTRRSPTQGWQ